MQWVQDELKSNQSNPELKKKTIDILQRIYTQSNDDNQILEELLQGADFTDCNDCDYEADLDSDDENVRMCLIFCNILLYLLKFCIKLLLNSYLH